MDEQALVDILQSITNTLEDLNDEVKDLKEDMRALKRGTLKEMNQYINNNDDSEVKARIESLETTVESDIEDIQKLKEEIENIKNTMKIQHMLVDEMI